MRKGLPIVVGALLAVSVAGVVASLIVAARRERDTDSVPALIEDCEARLREIDAQLGRLRSAQELA